MLPEQVLISCEHASNRIPQQYYGLGLAPALLASHIAWDPGARLIARHCARSLDCPYYEGKYSRLLVDLNRSLHHPKLIPTQSFAIPIVGNSEISLDERATRVQRYYLPFRTAVIAELRRIISLFATCLHLSVHSFTPVVGGQERRTDIGLLYDPRRLNERECARRLAESLIQHGLRVRLNYPYRGTSDGFTTHCRLLFCSEQYIGLEIEVNQRLLAEKSKVRRMAQVIRQSLSQSVEQFGPMTPSPAHDKNEGNRRRPSCRK